MKKLSERLSLGITAMLADFALNFSSVFPDTPDFLYVKKYINIHIYLLVLLYFYLYRYVIVSFVHNVKRNNKNYKFLSDV